MKVYVITKGSYSDYHICAVSLDPEEADRLARIYSDSWDSAGVEEFDTEEHRDWHAGRVPYIVTFHRGAYFLKPSVGLSFDSNFTPRIDAALDAVRVYLYAADAESALKIAADKRAEYLALRAGL
jgi:hypothetical protein